MSAIGEPRPALERRAEKWEPVFRANDATTPAVPSRTSAGFTLIEALVALAISALIAGVLFPSLERMLGYWRFREAMSATESALEEARATALRLGEPARFAVRPDGQGFVSVRGAEVLFPGDVRFVGVAAPLAFFADGSASGGRLRLVGAHREVWFTVAPETGLLDIGQ